jgi:hypothetical protein
VSAHSETGNAPGKTILHRYTTALKAHQPVQPEKLLWPLQLQAAELAAMLSYPLSCVCPSVGWKETVCQLTVLFPFTAWQVQTSLECRFPQTQGGKNVQLRPPYRVGLAMQHPAHTHILHKHMTGVCSPSKIYID